MQIITRIVLSGLGLLYLFMGAGFLADPAGNGGDFGLIAEGPQGLATIRGDLTAFFWVLGGSLLIGIWRRDASLLYVGAALAGIVFAGRALGFALDGSYPHWFVPMTVELVTVVFALVAARSGARV